MFFCGTGFATAIGDDQLVDAQPLYTQVSDRQVCTCCIVGCEMPVGPAGGVCFQQYSGIDQIDVLEFDITPEQRQKLEANPEQANGHHLWLCPPARICQCDILYLELRRQGKRECEVSMNNQPASAGIHHGLLDQPLDAAIVLKVQEYSARNQGHCNDQYKDLEYSFQTHWQDSLFVFTERQVYRIDSWTTMNPLRSGCRVRPSGSVTIFIANRRRLSGSRETRI